MSLLGKRRYAEYSQLQDFSQPGFKKQKLMEDIQVFQRPKRRARGIKQHGRKKQSLVKAVAHLQSQMRLHNKDSHYFDYNSSAAVTATTNIFSVMNVVESFGEQNRTGNKITVKSLDINFTLYSMQASAQTTVHVALVLDTSSDGAVPTDTEIYSGTNYWQAHRQDDLTGRFKILRSKQINMNSVNRPNHSWHERVTWPEGMMTQFLDNSGTATAFGVNQLYVFIVSDGLGTVAIAWNSRLRFLE